MTGGAVIANCWKVGDRAALAESFAGGTRRPSRPVGAMGSSTLLCRAPDQRRKSVCRSPRADRLPQPLVRALDGPILDEPLKVLLVAANASEARTMSSDA